MKTKTKKVLLILLLLGLTVFLLLVLTATFVQAVGLVDDTVDAQNIYSRYPLSHYQLDFYVDSSWDWLPWNWTDGIGNQVQYGLYAISNFIWTISLYLSNATGYLIQQAYTLDFISDTANQIGKNMQILAGVSSNGFSQSGFYVGFLLLFILIIGAYVGYVGLIKRETSKAIQAVTNFVVVFLLSAGFIAYAPSYIQKLNDFSADISQASLELGSKIILPHSDSQGKDSVDLIRNTLFSVQVEQPWLLLQFDQSSKEEIGASRVEALVSIDPNTNKGKDREEAVKKEIEEHDNQNLTLTKTTTRLGTVFFLFLFNIGISIFIFLLTGIMIFSQVLFILYAMFLPISFLLSMLPTFTSMGKSALMKLFNTIMLRAGITLIITAAFSLSTMLYSLTTGYPFFLVAFLQIVTFAGIYLKLGDIMSFFNLQTSDSQQVSRSVFRRPRQMAHRSARRLQRTVSQTLIGGTAGWMAGNTRQRQKQRALTETAATQTPAKKTVASPTHTQPLSRSYRTGQSIGKVMDTKNRVRQTMANKKQQVQELPKALQTKRIQSILDLKQGVLDEQTPSKKKNSVPISPTQVNRGINVPKKEATSSAKTHQRPTTVKREKPKKENPPALKQTREIVSLQNPHQEPRLEKTIAKNRPDIPKQVSLKKHVPVESQRRETKPTQSYRVKKEPQLSKGKLLKNRPTVRLKRPPRKKGETK